MSTAVAAPALVLDSHNSARCASLEGRKSNHEIRQVRFTSQQYRLVVARAAELGLPVSTFIKLVTLKATGSLAASEKIAELETRLSLLVDAP